MSEGIHVQVPQGYKGYSKAPRESLLTVATRDAVVRALRGTPVPDFSASIPPDFSSSNFEVRDPKAAALAKSLWREFLSYVELRRVEERETLELHRSLYPFNLNKEHLVDRAAIQKRQNSRMFALAESLLQKGHESSPGDLHAEMIGMAVTEPIGEELSATEKAAAFLLAFAYPGSEARQVIARAQEHRPGPAPTPRPKTPPPERMAA